ncbi:MAG: PorT family protein [Bacteroidales bacterium]|nr:PorT family protein [Bacteroidales bacterium]
MKFYKILASCALLMSLWTMADAQDLQFGVKGGFSASWLKGTVVTGYETVVPHNNFYAGAFASVDVYDDVFVQAELLYAGRGHSDRSEILPDYSRSLGYMMLPVFAGYHFTDDLSLMLGPEFGYLLFSKTKVGDVSTDTLKDCNRFNVCIAMQLNYMITDNFGVDVKFDWGLNRTFKPGMYAEGVNDDGRNMAAQIGFCYKFD